MPYIKILLFSLFTAAILIVRCHASWDGAYLGLSLGYESGNAKVSNAELEKPLSKWAMANALYGDFSFKGAKGEAHIGYGKTIDNHYVGFEASSAIYQSQGKAVHRSQDGFSGATTKLSLKILKNDSCTASFKGGYKLDDKTLIYFKPGISSSKFSFTLANTNNRDPEVNFSAGRTKRFYGLALELGVEMRISERFLLRVGGSHTFYRRKFFTAQETQCGRVRFSPQATQIKTGIVMPLFL